MSRTVGQKVGQFINGIYPVLEQTFSYLNPESSTDIDNEIVEASLSSLENMIRRCPRDAEPFIERILKHSMGLLTYDPNYTYDDNADE